MPSKIRQFHLVDRCVFIPFTRAEAPDFIDEAQLAEEDGDRGDAHRNRKWSVVAYDDPGEPLKELGFGLTTRILIAGHGAPGDPYLSNVDAPPGVEVPFNVVCDRMIEKGLQKRYTGAISCDVCYSAIKGNAIPSFADLVSRYLNHKGYVLLHTIGYMGPMWAAYMNMPGGTHKYLHRIVELADGTVAKTSDWAAWKHYSGVWSVPSQLKNLQVRPYT